MENFYIIASPIALYIFTLISPGQNFLIIAQSCLLKSKAEAIKTATGIATGSGIYAYISLFGLSFLAKISWVLFMVNVIAPTYLVYLGTTMIANKKPLEFCEKKFRNKRAYTVGLLINLMNSKTIFFFASTFNLAITRQPQHFSHLRLFYALIIPALSLCWYVTLANLFSLSKIKEVYLSCKGHIDKGVGMIFICIGAYLFFSLTYIAT